MGYEEHRHLSPQHLNCAVLIISDSRDAKTDESGVLLINGLKGADHVVSSFEFLKNDAEAIGLKLSELLHTDGVQVIIMSGGTGASRRDVTVETVTPMLQKVLPGFGELFRMFSYQEIDTGAILSRALAGAAQGRVIICLPGSVKAVELALNKIILPEIGHLVREASR
ncbi:MAG: molybdenum cofactor biosynthesis protein MoaB [Dehalococcoidia bacterium]|nr:molybdenum cofactor biosynthesis protein MoaB [Dehalococcoidia bacterium]